MAQQTYKNWSSVNMHQHQRLTAVITNAIASAAFSVRKWLWQTREGMPEELREATLLLSERPVWTHKPLPLYGVPDQVYRAANGDLILVDSKIRDRARVTLYDVVQLSTYRTILVHTRHPAIRGRSVRNYAYVRCEANGRVQYLAVHLLAPRDVVQFALAYLRSREPRRVA